MSTPRALYLHLTQALMIMNNGQQFKEWDRGTKSQHRQEVIASDTEILNLYSHSC